MKSDEAPASPIPATASDGVATVPGAGASNKPAFAATSRAGSHHIPKGGHDGNVSASFGTEEAARRDQGEEDREDAAPLGGVAVRAEEAVPALERRVGLRVRGAETLGRLGHLRKPQRRELSLPVAALAYTWAAVERRGRA